MKMQRVTIFHRVCDYRFIFLLPIVSINTKLYTYHYRVSRIKKDVIEQLQIFFTLQILNILLLFNMHPLQQFQQTIKVFLKSDPKRKTFINANIAYSKRLHILCLRWFQLAINLGEINGALRRCSTHNEPFILIFEQVE